MNKKLLIGAKIKAIRKKSGFTQEQFSEKISIEPTSLSNIENGKSFPSMQTVLNIIEQFGVKPQEFFDTDYLQKSSDLKIEMLEIIRNLSPDKTKILYRIVKSFDV